MSYIGEDERRNPSGLLSVSVSNTDEPGPVSNITLLAVYLVWLKQVARQLISTLDQVKHGLLDDHCAPNHVRPLSRANLL
jgi:hypothetical protein